ncbi:MAG: GreA/GreB family elongation factor [Kiritimatiellae bacterium]|jgi:transcription elongation GreA/GreB family factor|nr:GreA/GreB family elongation factor [Kiritimatiellia bacterium]
MTCLIYLLQAMILFEQTNVSHSYGLENNGAMLMNLPDEIKTKSKEELKSFFLEELKKGDFDGKVLVCTLGLIKETVDFQTADLYAEKLLDSLIEKNMEDDAFELWQIIAQWHPELSYRKPLYQMINKIFKQNQFGLACVADSSFEMSKVQTKEVARRLALLMSLKPDVLCWNRSFGIGVVKEVDSFAKKVVIDFEKKQNHSISFKFAADSLKLIPEGHILYMKFKDPEALAKLVAKKPSEVVKFAIKSHGPQSAVDVQFILSPDIVSEDQWKKFWTTARKGLKDDPFVNMPTKRNEPITILENEEDYGNMWFESFKHITSPADIFVALDILVKEKKVADLTDEQRDVLASRFEYILKVASHNEPVYAARLINFISNNKIDLPTFDVQHAFDVIEKPSVLVEAMNTLTTRLLKDVLTILMEHEPEKVANVILENIKKFTLPSYTECVNCLLTFEDYKPATCARVKQLIEDDRNIISITWMVNNVKLLDDFDVRPADFFDQVLMTFRHTFGGENLKAFNNMCKSFFASQWLKEILDAHLEGERQRAILRVRDATFADKSTKRLTLERIVALYPELTDLSVRKADILVESDLPTGRFTSWKSYKERSLQLQEINEVKIPANTKDIAVARSYGDLRENFEYEEARRQQGILMQQKDELEDALNIVKGTDFDGFFNGTVGMGAMVVLKTATKTKPYTVLGEWDSDESMNVISSNTGLAKILEGKVAGDKVRIPTLEGEEDAEIVEVKELSDEIKKWISIDVA